MRIVAGVLCMLLLAAGCSEKDKIPSGVIAKEEMEKILWDMMLADQYSLNYLVKDSAKINVKLETLKLYEEVFRLHKVSREEFSKSFQFYQGRPDITRTMLDSLQARGNRTRMENYNRPPSTPPVVPPVKKPAAAQPGKPGATPLNKSSGTFPNHLPVNPAGRPGFFPNRPATLPPGGRPFLSRESARPLKAGEMPFKPVKKDSVNRGRQ